MCNGYLWGSNYCERPDIVECKKSVFQSSSTVIHNFFITASAAEADVCVSRLINPAQVQLYSVDFVENFAHILRSSKLPGENCFDVFCSRFEFKNIRCDESCTACHVQTNARDIILVWPRVGLPDAIILNGYSTRLSAVHASDVFLHINRTQ